MAPVAQLPLEAALDYIQRIDFSNIIDKAVHHQGWLRRDAVAVCQMYRNFLHLRRKYGSEHELPPSEEIDAFWHLHILDTKKYRQDCDAIFGEYLDHYPYFGIDEATDFSDLEGAFENMVALYAKEFNGAELHQVRTVYSRFLGFLIKLFTRKPRRIIATSSANSSMALDVRG